MRLKRQAGKIYTPHPDFLTNLNLTHFKMETETYLKSCSKFDIHERIAESLNRQIIKDGLIPPPIPEGWDFDTTMPPQKEDYVWPEQQRARMFNPNPTNQDRFYLFIFLWRNMLNNPEKLHEYMTWYVNKKDPCVNNPAGIERHINQMVHTIKYPEQNKKQWELFQRIRYFSLVEHRVVDPEKEQEALRALAEETERGGSGLPATLPLDEEVADVAADISDEVSNPEVALATEEHPLRKPTHNGSATKYGLPRAPPKERESKRMRQTQEVD